MLQARVEGKGNSVPLRFPVQETIPGCLPGRAPDIPAQRSIAGSFDATGTVFEGGITHHWRGFRQRISALDKSIFGDVNIG